MVGKQLIDAYNGDNADAPRTYPVVIRGHRLNLEMQALHLILCRPETAADPFRSRGKREPVMWSLPLSLAWWVLRLLGHPAAREPGEDAEAGLGRCAKPALRELAARIRAHGPGKNLVALATGAIDWQTYRDGTAMPESLILTWMGELVLSIADAVFVTPALCSAKPWSTFQSDKAKVVLIDEAGAISRADA